VDVRGLRASQLAKDGAGTVFFAYGEKTGKPVRRTPSDRTLPVIESYLVRGSNFAVTPTSSETGAGHLIRRIPLVVIFVWCALQHSASWSDV
jgi:hypothetical protein